MNHNRILYARARAHTHIFLYGDERRKASRRAVQVRKSTASCSVPVASYSTVRAQNNTNDTPCAGTVPADSDVVAMSSLLLLLLLLLLTVAVGSATCDGNATAGLAATMARVLHRMRQPTRDYRLTDDLWLETLPSAVNRDSGPPPGPVQSRPPHADLARLADAVFDTHRLSWRNAVADGIGLAVYKDRTRQRYAFDLTRHGGTADGKSPRAGTRTFGGHRRRMQLMLPIMYKLGVITTLLFGLTLLSVKGVTIGVILLMLAVTSIVSKLSRAHGHHAPYYGPSWSAGVHDVYDRSSQQQPPYAAPEKSIHVHVHTAPGAAVKGPPQPYDAGAAYWNRGGVGVGGYRYDDGPPADGDYHYYYRGPGSDVAGSAAGETSTDGAYHRWLG